MPWKTLSLVGAGAAMLATLPSAHALELLDGKVEVDFQIRTGFQSLDADPGTFAGEANEDPAAGFQTMYYNIPLTIHFTDYITGYVDTGEEPNDFGQDFRLVNDWSWIDIELLQAVGSPAAGRNEIHLRAGKPVAGVVNFRGYSDGAAVQGNPLIGNSPLDLFSGQTGVKLIGSHQVDGAIESFGWDAMLSNRGFGENFDTDRGWDLSLRGRVDLGGGFKIGAGYFTGFGGEDQFETQVERNPLTVGGQTGTGVGNVLLPIVPFGSGDYYNLPGSPINAKDQHAGLVPGVDANIAEIDVEYAPSDMPFLLRGWVARLEDDFEFADSSGDQTVRSNATALVRGNSEAQGWALEGTYFLAQRRYHLATRYTEVANVSDGVSGDPKMTRLQIGGGWRIHPTTMLKVEWMEQTEEENSPGQVGDDWSGFTVELSAAF